MLYCVECRRPAVWGSPVGHPTHCTRHKRLGSRRKRTCSAPGCDLRPTYNYADRPGLWHCARHKLAGCARRRRKCACGRLFNYGRGLHQCGACRRLQDGTSTITDIERAIRGLEVFIQAQIELKLPHTAR